MKQRFFELVLLIVVIGLVVGYQRSPEEPRQATESPELLSEATPSVAPVVSTLQIGEPVPYFRLAGPAGKRVNYEPGHGPLLVVLTATGCSECLDRIHRQDREAYELAKSSGLEVWNLLVYHPAAGATEFVKRNHPTADHVLADPGAEVSVRTLGGSDATCWILIDREGRLAYRGPSELTSLQRAVANL